LPFWVSVRDISKSASEAASTLSTKIIFSITAAHPSLKGFKQLSFCDL